MHGRAGLHAGCDQCRGRRSRSGLSGLHRLGAAGNHRRHARQQFERRPRASLRLDARQRGLGGRASSRRPARALQRGRRRGRNPSRPWPRQASRSPAIRRAARKGDCKPLAFAGAGNARARRLRPADPAGQRGRPEHGAPSGGRRRNAWHSHQDRTQARPEARPTGRLAFAASPIWRPRCASSPRSWC